MGKLLIYRKKPPPQIHPFISTGAFSLTCFHALFLTKKLSKKSNTYTMSNLKMSFFAHSSKKWVKMAFSPLW